MNCYYHSNRESSAQCTDCGKYLCKTCASHFEIPLCYDCAKKRNENLKKTAFKNLTALIAAVVIGTIIGIWQYTQSSYTGIASNIIAGWIIGLALAGIPVGWKALDKITPNIFLILPVIGWVIYFLIKGALSMIVGVFLLPFRTVKGLIQYSKTKKLEKFIDDSYSQ